MNDDPNDEVRITFLHPPTSRTDMIAVPGSTTTLADLSGYATALLGIITNDVDNDDDDDDADRVGGGGGSVLTRGTSLLYHPSRGDCDGSRTLASCGVSSSDGDALVSAYSIREYDDVVAAAGRGGGRAPPPSSTSAVGTTAAAARGGGGGGGGGGLDFTSLLGGGVAGAGAQRSSSSSSSSSSGVGALDFSSLVGNAGPPVVGSRASLTPTTTSVVPTIPPRPVEWDGMSLDDAISRNPDPVRLATLLSDAARHPNLMKELNYHNPSVCKRLREVYGDVNKMAEVWRQATMRSTMSRFLRGNEERNREAEMRRRLLSDPMDADANMYFGEKIRLENVARQYERMMEEYPESMGKVLMLYVGTTVNGKPLQVFVDSGAQSTIMSSACADRLDLLHLVDKRFAGVAVGVGTGKILGRVHVVEMVIGGCVLPCSVTIMDSEKGLGDKNMDCLFGLDMLRRHRCSIDLGGNVLRFSIGAGGETMEAPFLHEKDLPTSKGGTMDFDPEKANAMVEARMERMDTDEDDDDGEGGGEGGDEDPGKGKAKEGGGGAS
ncbi:hypothetical protein ACHAW5_002085 [Stephanodiscus triporus]|uniref:Aspartic peptidase DDI1-type domain-containing protein n=1 Tax=Stephanodiscus triporus TaxID=2934178 RepID=A0ABD3MV46_9STRA